MRFENWQVGLSPPPPARMRARTHVCIYTYAIRLGASPQTPGKTLSGRKHHSRDNDQLRKNWNEKYDLVTIYYERRSVAASTVLGAAVQLRN